MPRPRHRSNRRSDDKDFTGGAIHGLSTFQGTTGDKETDQKVMELVKAWGCGKRNSLVEEMIITALRIGHDKPGMGELKMINRSLKELREASNVFRPYQKIRKVSVFGSARTDPEKPEYKAAEEFSRKMAEQGFMIITGAGDGIMGAAQKGAGREKSFGLNIRLPFEQGANETIVGDTKLVDFNYFFTRKLNFVKEAEACALFP
ncbi:MAG: cytochrome D ubiquinol oxidase subunit II, partial [Verrucomicrobiota bacterium]